MEKYTTLDDWNPDPATLRRWAYDENLLLSDQDEDLALYREEHLPVLLPFADDPACPKADYILSCLDGYLMDTVLRGTDSQLKALDKAAALAEQALLPRLHAWGELQRRRLKYRVGVGPVSRDDAVIMGQDLLIGICRVANFTIAGESTECWELRLSVPSQTEHLSINKTTGRFTYWRDYGYSVPSQDGKSPLSLWSRLRAFFKLSD